MEKENPERGDHEPEIDFSGLSNDGVNKSNMPNEGKHDSNINGREKTSSMRGKHLSSSEKVTLINLIRTLDKDNILRDRREHRGPGLTTRKQELWDKILPAFNEICGLNCKLRKIQDLLHRIQKDRIMPAYSALYAD